MQQPLCQQTVMELSNSEVTELTALLSSIQDPSPNVASLLRRLSTQRDDSNDTDSNAVQSIGVASQEAVHTAHSPENQTSHAVQVDESTSSVHASASGSEHTQIEQLTVGNQLSYYSIITVPGESGLYKQMISFLMEFQTLGATRLDQFALLGPVVNWLQHCTTARQGLRKMVSRIR